MSGGGREGVCVGVGGREGGKVEGRREGGKKGEGEIWEKLFDKTCIYIHTPYLGF